MKAIQFEQYGEPAKVFAVQERPIPEPGKGEVRVRILASPVNPSDLLFVRGHYAGVQPHFPSTAGFEGVGIVDVLGPQVHRPMHGQRVAVINAEKGGNWADYAVVPADLLLPVPDDLPDEQVASFFINPASAIVMLRSLTGEPIRVGADPRLILAGRRILEIFWLGYWFSKLDETVRTDLVQEIVTLLRDGILVTSTAARTFSLDEIRAAVTQAESIGRQGKVLLVPEKQ
jgi:NADPH:quinone reductase-like Zn-dependent oxidoreductase